MMMRRLICKWFHRSIRYSGGAEYECARCFLRWPVPHFNEEQKSPPSQQQKQQQPDAPMVIITEEGRLAW